MKRFFEIGDIVYLKKEGVNSQFEIVRVYPLEAKESHFVLRRICGFDPFQMAPCDSERMYATEYFYPMYWVNKRSVIVEKIK